MGHSPLLAQFSCLGASGGYDLQTLKKCIAILLLSRDLKLLRDELRGDTDNCRRVFLRHPFDEVCSLAFPSS